MCVFVLFVILLGVATLFCVFVWGGRMHDPMTLKKWGTQNKGLKGRGDSRCVSTDPIRKSLSHPGPRQLVQFPAALA